MEMTSNWEHYANRSAKVVQYIPETDGWKQKTCRRLAQQIVKQNRKW